jgi:hypothetical protein
MTKSKKKPYSKIVSVEAAPPADEEPIAFTAEPAEWTMMEEWMADGLPCKSVRFINPVPLRKNTEPVHEFYIASETKHPENNKYLVDSLCYTRHGLIFEAYGEIDIIPLGNIVYVRTI